MPVRRTRPVSTGLVLLICGSACTFLKSQEVPAPPDITAGIQVPAPPLVLPDATVIMLDSRVNTYHNIPFVRRKYGVSGKGLTVAVLDTGINPYHEDFRDKIVHMENFTGGDPTNAHDFNGHGSHVTSVIAASAQSRHLGVAPAAKIVALKVFKAGQQDPSPAINSALKWLVEHHKDYGISVVNLSLGDTSNQINDLNPPTAALAETCGYIRKLREENIAVVVAAGNYYHHHQHPDEQGMAFPAICREAVSVGSMYGVDKTGDGENPLQMFTDGSFTLHAVSHRCTPFTQRLSSARGGEYRTDIFAAGFDVTGASPVVFDVAANAPNVVASSSGSVSDSGTSFSAPFISGLILLMQEHYRKLHGGTVLPEVDKIEKALWEGGLPLEDKEDAIAQRMDNVRSSNETFRSAQAERSFEALARPDQVVTTPFHELDATQLDQLRSDLQKKAELVSKVRDGIPDFPSFKPNVRFYVATRAQRHLAELVSASARERFNPLPILNRVSPVEQRKIEVRYFRFPDDTAVAVAMADLIREQLKDADSGVELIPSDVAAKYPFEIGDPPGSPGDIEVWFPQSP